MQPMEPEPEPAPLEADVPAPALPEPVSGRVLDADGMPVEGAVVAVVSSDGPHRDIAAFTAGDGTFRLGGVPQGRVVLQARKSGVTGTADVEVLPGPSAPVEINLA